MRILIMSDTHRNSKAILEVKEKVGDIDMLIHLGDVCGDENLIQEQFNCEIHMVAGNCDYDSWLPREEEFMIRDKKVFITHGHRYGVNYGTEQLQELIKQQGYDIVMYGHTHVRKIEQYGGSYIINPGSLAMPRDGGYGSFILMDFDQNGKPFFSQNELENKKKKAYYEELFW